MGNASAVMGNGFAVMGNASAIWETLLQSWEALLHFAGEHFRIARLFPAARGDFLGESQIVLPSQADYSGPLAN